MAVKIGTERAANPEYPYENNLLQMSRIWRAYVISELADNFGPVLRQTLLIGIVEYKSIEDIL